MARLPEEPSLSPSVECPPCGGTGRIERGIPGKRHAVSCGLCHGRGRLDRTVRDAFRAGVEMGRSSAYIGHYDQYDTGSLMYADVQSPYDAHVIVKGEVNYRAGF